MGHFSFRLLKEYPNESYLEVLEMYSKKNLYRNICREQNFDDAVNFFESVALYKNKVSADLLNQILNRKPFMPCPSDSDQLRGSIYSAIWHNQCDAYSAIIDKIRPYMDTHQSKEIALPLDSSNMVQIDETTRW